MGPFTPRPRLGSILHFIRPISRGGWRHGPSNVLLVPWSSAKSPVGKLHPPKILSSSTVRSDYVPYRPVLIRAVAAAWGVRRRASG